MKGIRDKSTRCLYTAEMSLWRFECLCRHCGNQLKTEIKAARDALRLTVPWRSSKVHKMAKHKYNLDVDDIYVYEVEFVGENDRCLRDCAMSGSNGTPEEDSDIDTENDADAEGGDSEDETSSMHDSTSSQDSGKSTLSDAVSFLDPMDGDTGISSTSDCLDWAGFDRQRDCSSPSSEVIWSDTPTIETPPWDSLNLASSSSSDETGSVFSDDTIISSWTTRGEDGSADEDDSRICPRRCLDLEDMEDWSIDGCGNLWPMIF